MAPFLFLGGGLYVDIEAISFLLRRGNSETHTFHAAFGEITVTLEDVAMSTLLPLTGDVDSAHCGDFLSTEEREVRDALLDIHDRLLLITHWNIMKATFFLLLLLFFFVMDEGTSFFSQFQGFLCVRWHHSSITAPSCFLSFR